MEHRYDVRRDQPFGREGTMTGSGLSEQDVKRLLVDRSPQARIETMSKVVADFESGRFAAKEQDLVRQILQRLAIDAEMAVREAVAWQIYNSPLLNDDLAQRLAHDVAEVAFPILRHASALSDDFLVGIVQQRDSKKQVAVAARDEVSAGVSDAIVDTGNVTAIERLVRNSGAVLSEPTFHKTLDRFGAIEAISESMAGRGDLPITVVEKLIHYVSEEIRDELAARHDLPVGVLGGLVAHGREAATLLLLKPLSGRFRDVELFVKHLHANNRLSPSLLFRALCSGDVEIFVAGIAVRCNLSVANARLLVFDEGQLGLRAAFERSKIPTSLLPPFRSALAVVRDTGYRGDDDHRASFQKKAVARVFNDCGGGEDTDVEELLLQLFDQKTDVRLKDVAPAASCDDSKQ
jgi:uncharacterized protein (DUF2336 family)